MNNLLLPHDRMVDRLLSQVANHAEGSFQARPIGLRMNPSADHLEAAKVVDEHPLSGLGLFVVVGQVSKAAHCRFEEFVIAAVGVDDSKEFSDTIGVTNGKFQRLVVHGQVGDDAGGADDDWDFWVIQKFDKLASKVT